MTKAQAQPNTPAQKYPLGNAKENKDATVYTGTKFFDAETKDPIGKYTQPRVNTMPAKSAVEKSGNGVDSINMSINGFSKNPNPAENKHGEKTMRGYGAATKGIKFRGPSA